MLEIRQPCNNSRVLQGCLNPDHTPWTRYSVFQLILLSLTGLYQLLAIAKEFNIAPPGKRIDVGGYYLHVYQKNHLHPPIDCSSHSPTIVIDHSLGGVEGYALVDALSELGPVCIYDRAGYGWSDMSPHSRTSKIIVQELDRLLTNAKIEPPYLLVGDSFGTYNMRLYAHRFPKKVAGLVLTDGLHESGMLKMPIALKALQLVFLSGFLVSIVGASVGLIQVLRALGILELLKPELRRIDPDRLENMTRSFCRPKHWITMAREIWGLAESGRDVSIAKDLGDLPIVSIKSKSFFKPGLWTRLVPLKQIDRLRDQMHMELLQLSTRSRQVHASGSSHFVWIDEPEIIITAVKEILITLTL